MIPSFGENIRFSVETNQQFESPLRYLCLVSHQAAPHRSSPQLAVTWAVSFALERGLVRRNRSHALAGFRPLRAAPGDAQILMRI